MSTSSASLVSRVLLDPLNALLDILSQIRKSSIKQLLLIWCDLSNGVDLLHAIRSKLNFRGEEINSLVLVERAVNKGGFNNALLALSSLEKRLSHTSTGHGHGESGRPSTIFSLDDFVTAKLDTVHELVEFLALEVGAALAEERNDGDTGVTTDDSDVLVGGVGAFDFADEAAGTNDVESGDTEETLGVVDALGLEDLGGDWNGGVDLTC
jgi:hypothetical protein